MKINFLITHFATTIEHRNVLLKTIESILEQRPTAAEVSICVVDDGSYWSQGLFDSEVEEIKVFAGDEVKQEEILRDIFCDSYVVTNKMDKYNKAELLNLAVENNKADFYVILDDDHPFLSNKSLLRYLKYFETHDFVMGRLLNSKHKARRYSDRLVQGTNFGLSAELLRVVGGFGEYTAEWGRGEDSDIFYKVFSELKRDGARKAIYAGEIITIDLCSGRWLGCEGGEDRFITGFKKIHGVAPFDNEARSKQGWMAQSRPSEVIEYLFNKLNPYPRLRKAFCSLLSMANL